MAKSKKKQATFLIIASEFKGVEFIKSIKEAGSNIILVISKYLENDPWPKDHIDEIFYVESKRDQQWNMEDVVNGMAFVMRNNKIDRVVALDDFDVEKAAELRECFRLPGMGQTTFRYFRDKLAMRVKAEESGIAVPVFSSLFNNDEISAYCENVAPPWMVKPRFKASASGITKLEDKQALYEHLHKLGDDRHNYLIEQFRPGDVFHVDSVSYQGKPIFSRVSQYLDTPMEVAHGGGIFRSHTIKFGSKDEKALIKMNSEVLQAFGMEFSASHTEFIKDKETGKFVFLETASRVGGAHLAEMVEYSSGISLWKEWARIEVAEATGQKYKLPKTNKDYTGIIVSLAKDKHPDGNSFNDPEIVWRLNKEYHIGFIVKSKKQDRVLELLDQYAKRIAGGFHASMPSK